MFHYICITNSRSQFHIPIKLIIMKNRLNGPRRPRKTIVFSFYLIFSAVCGLNSVSAQEPVLHADIMPLFEGGEAEEFSQWVRKRCVYPAEALSENISGRVNYSFVVDKTGKITDVLIIDSPHQSLSWEVRDIVSGSPKWTPGQNGKKKVPVRFYMHIDFELKERPADSDSIYEPAGFQNGYLPQFRNWVAGKIKYPYDLREEGVQGLVRVRFVIEKDGSLTNIIIDKSPHERLSSAVRRVLEKSPKWTPATLDGEPIRLRYTMPIEFQLDGDASPPAERKIGQPKIFGPVR